MNCWRVRTFQWDSLQNTARLYSIRSATCEVIVRKTQVMLQGSDKSAICKLPKFEKEKPRVNRVFPQAPMVGNTHERKYCWETHQTSSFNGDGYVHCKSVLHFRIKSVISLQTDSFNFLFIYFINWLRSFSQKIFDRRNILSSTISFISVCSNMNRSRLITKCEEYAKVIKNPIKVGPDSIAFLTSLPWISEIKLPKAIEKKQNCNSILEIAFNWFFQLFWQNGSKPSNLNKYTFFCRIVNISAQNSISDLRTILETSHKQLTIQ